MTYYYKCLISLLVLVSTHAAPKNLLEQKKAALVSRQIKGTTDDLKTSSSSYSSQYSNWGGHSPGGYGFSITGIGTIDRSDYYDPSYNTLGGYDSSIKNTGYGSSGYGLTGYGGQGSEGYIGGRESYGGYGQSGYGAAGFSPSGYSASGFGASGLDGASGYINNAGYGGGNGGYGGYGGNGGLTSYYGYNNPSYQGAGHLGYGYYNKKPGYGNIYSSGITPSLVTGYRGYSRR
ncbi:glycine-rich RNA-binding protein 3, mitochondrial-like [Maniola jurtina]|uniref:glycine-rich RNA-binding protein 3, mitochondrial-like n=1 Tax=Maniola jurtina TaxID=191418 RepID=UPI001E68ACC9|nr:glycine-rich RNA-binding protein 3, mitochondrial-like [Maniola jurtina]